MEATTPRRDIDVGRVISEAFSIYGSHAGVLLGTSAIFFVVVGVINGLLLSAGGVFLYLLTVAISIVAITLFTGFVVKLVEDVRDGRRDSTIGELMSSATPAIGPLILNGFLRAIAIAVGFVLLIVPGLILLTIWAVTAPAIVVERVGAIDAFGRSRELVRGNGWSVFAVIVIAFLISLGVGLVLGGIGAGIGGAGAVIFRIVSDVVTAPIAALVAAILFFDLGGGRQAAAAPAAPAEPPPPPAAPAA
jgi:putative effector of murein hydrolase LrgA (UPF0299 family)